MHQHHLWGLDSARRIGHAKLGVMQRQCLKIPTKLLTRPGFLGYSILRYWTRRLKYRETKNERENVVGAGDAEAKTKSKKDACLTTTGRRTTGPRKFVSLF